MASDGNAVVSGSQVSEANLETDVEAFSLILQSQHDLPETTISTVNSAPVTTNLFAPSHETQASFSSSESSDSLATQPGLQSLSDADSLAGQIFAGTSVHGVIEKQESNNLGLQPASSGNDVVDQSLGQNLLESIVITPRADYSSADTRNEGASKRSSSPDSPPASAPDETRTLTLEPVTPSVQSFRWAPGSESAIDVPRGIGVGTPDSSDTRPVNRGRNTSSGASPYRSLPNDAFGKDAGETQSNSSLADRPIATHFIEPVTNDTTEKNPDEPVDQTSGFVQNPSQQPASTPDAPPKDDAASKAPIVNESLISSRQSSQQQHQISTNQPDSSQSLFPSSTAAEAISSANTTRSSAETQSFTGGLPMDLRESGKLSPQGNTPVKEISIRVEASSGEIVHLKVVDQVNQVQIGVRSSNAALATNLRQDLSSLTATLDRLGWKSAPPSEQALVETAATTEAGSGANDQSDTSHSQAADWWNNPEQNRRSPSELWEEALNR
jgi:hypothetical protein